MTKSSSKIALRPHFSQFLLREGRLPLPRVLLQLPLEVLVLHHLPLARPSLLLELLPLLAREGGGLAVGLLLSNRRQ